MATFTSALKSRVIYVFGIADEAHRGCLKVGETTLHEDIDYIPAPNSDILRKAAKERIDEYTTTCGISFELLYTEMTMFISKGTFNSFNDKQVHDILLRSGVERKDFGEVNATEWFCCDLETIKKAISAAKQGLQSLNPEDVTHHLSPIVFRPEQREAIEQTKKQFKKGNQMLWNAKMRFGKTLSALQVVKDEGYKRTIILTHRPVVDEGWFEDYQKIFYDRNDYHYGSRNKGETFGSLQSLAAKGDSYVYFASMQDLRGSEEVGGKFDKNDEIFATPWDLLIVDEAHEGTKTDLGASVIAKLTKPTTKVLKLSGTPFNLLDDYKENEVFTWDYIMEQKAKSEWDTQHVGEPNPYSGLPAINIYTYDLGNLMSEYADDEKAFNFREFFRTHDDGTFIHDKDVDRFLYLLCKDDKDSLYPYSNDQFRKIFRHTLWVVPGVAAAKALSRKLQEHPVFGQFHVVNVAGDGDDEEENRDALQMVNDAIGKDSGATWTITLSCGKLTTGVSIKPWTAVFMMAGTFSTSAAQYMQTIFRVQTPYTYNGQMKTECYAFDFAPDRTLRVLAEAAKVSTRVGKQTDDDRKTLGDFLNFCPIIAIEGSKMKHYDVDRMMGQLKRAQIERVVQDGFENGALYNDELLKLTDVDLKDFADLKKQIGTTKAMPKTGDIDVNRQGFTNEEYEEKERLQKKPKKQLTEEEKKRLEELKKKGDQRKSAISILRGISIRMPLLIYGAELSNEEDITLDNFAQLIDPVSWDEFMPRGVTKQTFNKFKKYYDPDVFREAGKRIREMARAADKFSIEERIFRIITIFNTFRNPDKETVLTPWRVVNMQLSDCLGGYCFYDEQFQHPLEIPRYVSRGNVTKEAYNPEKLVMEINSKSGLYPLFCAYNIYRRRVEAMKEKYGEIGQAFAMSLWDATIEQNIFVVCKTPMAVSITHRTLAGFRNVAVNAMYYSNIVERISNTPDSVANLICDGKHFWKKNDNKHMNFNLIVGNPPYQQMDGGYNASAVPVYNKFIDLAKRLQPNYLSMIMPAKWYNGGRGLDDFRTSMLSDKSIQYLYDYVDGHECFPTVDIAGGVCYFLWNKNYKGLCEVTTHFNGEVKTAKRDLGEGDVFIRHKEELSILSKVKKCTSKFLDVYPQKPFGLRTYVKPTEDGDIELRYNGGIGKFHSADITINQQLIGKWKIVTSRLTAEHAGETDKNGQKRILATLEVLAPNVVCTETYMLLAVFDSELEANNFFAYLKTRFVRSLIAMVTASQQMSRASFRFVPFLDFSRSWSNADLYAKYGLTDEEILFIESTIKPMD